MGDINAPEYAVAKEFSDFVVFVKNAEKVFVDTSVLLNEKGQLFVDFKSAKEMYMLCVALSKHLIISDWKVNGKKVYLYTDGKEKRAIMTPFEILPYREF